MLGLDMATNYSYFAVPAAFLLLNIPHAISIGLWAQGIYDLAYPRKLQVELIVDERREKPKYDKALANRILRAESATANGLENLPLFAGGVVAVNVATASPSTSSVPIINALCFAYLALRTAYNVVYVWGQEDRRLALLRSATWIAGSMCAMALWIMAGFAAMSNSSR